MEIREAKRALIAGAEVIGCIGGWNEITYKGISALIYRKKPKSGRLVMGLELADRCGRSVGIFGLEQVRLAAGWERKLPRKIPPAYEDRPTMMELNAKKALKSGCAVIFDGDRWRVTALKVCNWVKLDYWLHVELTRISDGMVDEAWAGSIVMEDKLR